MGWGGKRVGAGRKRKQPPLGASLLVHPSAPPPPPVVEAPAAPIEEFDAPDDLDPEARAIWTTQAPLAFRNGTLTRATALSFARYCRIVVLERHEARSSAVGGANHRGLLKQLNALEQQFLLAPSGKPMLVRTAAEQPQADQPVSKLARFRRPL
jgi:hypothetical protein